MDQENYLPIGRTLRYLAFFVACNIVSRAQSICRARKATIVQSKSVNNAEIEIIGWLVVHGGSS